MNTTTSPDVYRCHWCTSLNDAMKADWCLCATSQRTLVCASCTRCFCAAPERVRNKFWELASADLVARRWQAGKTAAPKPIDPSALQRPVILVVDDTKLIHTIVDTILASLGGTILHAFDGAEGYRMARTIQPDVLITDALLPGLDGRDVVRLLKGDPTTAGIRAVIMTALYKGSRYRNEAFRDFRCDAYIEKPVSAEELRKIVAQMLEQNAAQDERAIAS